MTSTPICPTASLATASSPAAGPTRPRAARLLTADEERSLAAALAAGDRDARDRLVRSNLGLVAKIARDYLGRGLELDDLIGEGHLGLIRAAEDFDPRFGTRFSTYAAYWIKQAIRHALTNTAAPIRLPAHMVTLLSKWRQAERALSGGPGEPPGFDRVAAELGLSEAQRVLVRRALDSRRFAAGGDDRGEGSRLASSAWDGPGPGEQAERCDAARGLLARMAGRLDAREREILTLRFGLGGGEPLTLKEVGRRLGITREWVRKIEKRAVALLRDGSEDAA
jgi:RNA polymerase primary sigma factor